MKITYEISLLNPRRKVVLERRERAHSLVDNYYTDLYSALTGEIVTLTDLNGHSRTHYYHAYRNKSYPVLSARASEGDTSRGILIGTSDTPVSPMDYKLAEQFECHYLAVEMSDIYQEGDSFSLDISRIFVNDNIDVQIKEFGLACEGLYDYTSRGYFLIFREVVTPIDFPVDYSLRIKIKFTI